MFAPSPCRLFLCLLLALWAALPLTAGELVHVRLEGPLDKGMLPQLSRAVREARSQPGSTLVVEIDTPGGAVDLMWDLSKQLRAVRKDGVATVAWINRHAVSAGVLLAISCERVYMVSEGSIGSALPVTSGPAGLAPVAQDEAVREKITSAMRSDFRAMAESMGRPAALAEAMVDPNARVYQIRREGELELVSGQVWDDLRAGSQVPELVATISGPGQILNLSARRAVELRFADGIAESLDEVAQKSGFPGGAPRKIERSASDDWIKWIDLLTPLLLVAGLLLAYSELKLPGFGLPGILSILCFAVLLLGRYFAGLADVLHLVVVGAGIALIVTEIFFIPGSLWAGISGFVLLLGGLLLSGLGPEFSFASAYDRQRLLDASTWMIASACAAVAGMLILSRLLPKTPLLGRMVLQPGESGADGGAMPETRGRGSELARVGAVGSALSALRPVGKVALDGDSQYEFEARSSGALIEAGARVRVVEVAGGRLVVEVLKT
jgi:membrane-bound serine protease (ClpP class)